MPKFKEFSFDRRQKEAVLMRSKYPDRIPVIVESASSLPSPLDKSKYLVPGDLSWGQFLTVLRKRLTLSPQVALFLFVNKGTLPSCSTSMNAIYVAHKDDDQFLYGTLCGENTFG